jgi:hypothetical protein
VRRVLVPLEPLPSPPVVWLLVTFEVVTVGVVLLDWKHGR